MKPYFLPVILVASLIGWVAHAAPVTVETNNWVASGGPAFTSPANPWTTGGTSASQGGNNISSLVSDFDLLTDFVFTGVMRATSDDDNMGVVFNWIDESNHYRMGWEGGGWGDTGSSHQDGFWLIVEIGGVDAVLANISGLFWGLNIDYSFSIARTGSLITYSIMNGASNVVSGTTNHSTFTTGKVGVYQESNYTQFTRLAVDVPSAVPLPASLPLLGAGLGLAGLISRRRKR